MQVSVDASVSPCRCWNDVYARAHTHDNIEVINLHALQRRSTSDFRWHHTCDIRVYSNIRVSILVVLPRFHVVLQVHDRRVNRTTCPATLIVAWLVNLYIVFKRYLIGHSLLCYNHPPLKIHVIPLACYYFRYIGWLILLTLRLSNCFVVCVISHRRHVKLYWLRVCCYLSLITTVWSSV
jgi:hypothetical protein